MWVSSPSTVTGPASAWSSWISYQSRCFATGSSRATLPWSRSCNTPTAVKSFEMEQMEYIVDAVAGSCRSTCAYPYPFAHTSSWSCTTEREAPGMPP